MASEVGDHARVAIIGAGASGLTSIKGCLEDGLDPVCYERYDKLGGLWSYNDNVLPGQGAAMYRSCCSVISKEMLSFSDFPLPKECTPFLPHKVAAQYFSDYANHFDLEKYIKFNTSVMNIERNRDDGNGRYWKVVIKNQDDSVSEEYFDYVMVCIGMFNKPFTPDYPGLDTFKGIKIHGNQYRDATKFTDKKVVVVGGSNTAGDVAGDIARVGDEVYLSMRNGTYCLPRILANGLPWDMQFLTRNNFQKSKSKFTSMIDGIFRTRIPDYKMFGLQNTQGIFETHSLMANGGIQDLIVQGRITPVDSIQEFKGNDVILTNGKILKDIDAVIFGTGYDYSIPMVDQSLIYDESKNVKLYKYVFPVGSQHPERIAMVGMVEFFGPVWQMTEIQARWVTKVFTGKVKLPDKECMLQDIEKNPKYVGTRPQYVLLHPYMDDIAEFIGAKPNFWKLLFSDPKLAYLFEYGPMVPYWYRLQGPDAWSGAKDAILNAWENTKYSTRRYRSKEES
ncbi:flavin-containing monooxygenase 1-like isoform X1 [Glandiceps talaboti]